MLITAILVWWIGCISQSLLPTCGIPEALKLWKLVALVVDIISQSFLFSVMVLQLGTADAGISKLHMIFCVDCSAVLWYVLHRTRCSSRCHARSCTSGQNASAACWWRRGNWTVVITSLSSSTQVGAHTVLPFSGYSFTWQFLQRNQRGRREAEEGNQTKKKNELTENFDLKSSYSRW